MLRVINYLLAVFLVYSQAVIALSFDVPAAGNSIMGAVQTVQMQNSDDYSSIAERYDIGYYELFEANPDINPDNPLPGTYLIIPQQYIVPPQLSLKKDNVLVNVAAMRLYYYSSKLHKIFIFPIGIGKEGWKTPVGRYRIIQKIRNPVWHVPASIRKYRAAHGESISRYVAAGADNPMGRFALRLSNGNYLIHGTDDPIGVGRRSSAGCIRMYNGDIKQLFTMVNRGTIVRIVDKPYIAGFDHGKIYLEAHMPLYEDRMVKHGDITPAINVVAKVAGEHNLKVDSAQILKVATEHIGIPRPLV